MLKLFVEFDNVEFEVISGESLLDVAERANANILFGCFSGRCGICRIQVIEGAHNLSPVTELERDLLLQLNAAENERLACQCQINGIVKIRAQGAAVNQRVHEK